MDSNPLAQVPQYTNGRPARNGPLKRKAECIEPEFFSSSKRGEHSNKKSEARNHIFSDPSTNLKAMDYQFAQDGMLFLPEDIIKGQVNFQNMAAIHQKDKDYLRGGFEAGLKRATRRANEAEKRVQDLVEQYTNQARIDADANAEKLRKETEAIKSEYSSKNLHIASKDLISAHALAVAKCATLQERQTSLGQRLGKFIEGLEDMTMKEIKAAAICIEKDFHSVLDDRAEAGNELEKVGIVVERFDKVYKDEMREGRPEAREAELGALAMEEDKD